MNLQIPSNCLASCILLILAVMQEIAANCNDTPLLPHCRLKSRNEGRRPTQNGGRPRGSGQTSRDRSGLPRPGGQRGRFRGNGPINGPPRSPSPNPRPASSRFRSGFNKETGERCNYPDLWLIPGKADETCKRPGRPHVMNIDTDSVVISPRVLKLPGCFTIEMDIETLQSPPGMPTSFFGKAEYQWWNFPDFQELKCQNSSTNGCGGYGNNCFYCDICSSLQDLNRTGVHTTDLSRTQQSFAEQFRGIECPDRPSKRRLIREFCFNDWKVFDTNGDCKFDFLPEDYKNAIRTIGQVGYGTMIAKFKLSHNATGAQLDKKDKKETEIDSVVRKELQHRKSNWDSRRGPFGKFRDWYIQYRKDNWHRKKYLPWLIYTNEIACLKLTFDVCDKLPTGGSGPQNTRGKFSDSQYQCA